MTATTIDLDQVDWALYDRLVHDDTLWTLRDITRELQVNTFTSGNWERACRNYRGGAALSWPPNMAQLRKALSPAEPDAPRLPDWPAHPAVLPPPEPLDVAEPHWRAGAVRQWAMQAGRMRLDGTPQQAQRGGHVAPATTAKPKPVKAEPVPEISDADWALVLEALALDDPVTILDFSAMFGIKAKGVWHWERACRNYWERGLRAWPPTVQMLRTAVQRTEPCLTDWPAHRSVLPLPDGVEPEPRRPGDRPLMWWRRGTIYGWALRSGRWSVADLLAYERGRQATERADG